MKLQTSAFLDKGRELLGQADTMMDVGLNEAAGRTAYLAGLHAAQALIFESTGKIIKRHRGVQSELQRLTKSEPSFDRELQAFLGRAYHLKDIADYGTGAGAKVSAERALEAIQMARRFVECVATFIR